jgi:hypothetical protein
MPTDGSDYYNRFTSEDKKMAKGIGNWKPFKEPGDQVLIGNPLLSGQIPAEIDKKSREKAAVPAVSKTNPSPETVGGGSDKPNAKTPKGKGD